MTSYIVVSTNSKKRAEYIAKLSNEKKIDRFDLTYIEKESSKNLTSIGIETIKELHKKIFLKPIKSLSKAIILNDAHLLTIEAQNALLKVLEEPPEHTIILLSAVSTENLLPTIISRCQIVSLQKENMELTDSQRENIEKFINSIASMKVGEKLKKAEELAKDKDEVIKWIEKLILVLREKIIKQARDTRDTRGTHDTLKQLQSLHTLLKTTNVSPRFAIENTLLSL